MGLSGSKAVIIPIYDGDIIDQEIERKQSFVVFIKDAKSKEAHQQQEYLEDFRGANVPIYMISFDNASKSPILKELIQRIQDKTTYDAKVLMIRYQGGQLWEYTNKPLFVPSYDYLSRLRLHRDFINAKQKRGEFDRLQYGRKYYEELDKKYSESQSGKSGNGNGSSKSGLQWQIGGGPIGYGSKGWGVSMGGGGGFGGLGYSF